jgi:hypothetical protein
MASCSVIRNSNGEIQQVLAPNGKESNLFKEISSLVDNNKEKALELWAQTQTPQFITWFGNSKVVDENNEPLLVYHGTDADFSEFNKEKIGTGAGSMLGKGFYFTPVASQATEWLRMVGKTATHIMPNFLSIENPDVVSDTIKYYLNPTTTSKHDGVIAPNQYVTFEPNQIKSLFNIGDFSNSKNSIYYQLADGVNPDAVPSKVQAIAQKLYNRFGIPYMIVDRPNIQKRGWFAPGIEGAPAKVVLNLAHMNEETAFHEYIHPFIAVLRQQNPALYKSLMDQLSSDQRGQRAIAVIQEAYPELSQEGMMEEALVSYLGVVSKEQNSSIVARFIKWLKNLFKKIQMVNFQDLALDTKLKDVANMIVDDVYVADLRSLIQTAKVLSNAQKVDTELTYANVYDRIKDKVGILNRTIKNRKKGDQFKEDISELNDIIQNEDEVTSINNFIANSVTYVEAAQKRFESLRNSVKNVGQLSKDEVSYNLNILGEIQQLLNVYNSLDDVQSLLFREGNTDGDDTFAKLSKAILQKNQIIADFKSFSLTYLTEWLYPYLEPTNKNLEAQGQGNLVLSKEKFREQMVMALRDISAAGLWLGTSINSRDPVSAAIGLALKDVVYDNHVKDLAIKHELTTEYEKVRGTALYKTAKDEEAFNSEFLRTAEVYEKVGVDKETGEPIFDYVKRLAFYEEYQMDQFEKAKNEFYESIGERPTEAKAYKAWSRAQSAWYVSNVTINDKWAEIRAEKKAKLSKLKFEEWWLSNTKELDDLDYGQGRYLSTYYGSRVISRDPAKGTFRVLSGQLVRPAEKYKDKKFPTLMKNAYYNKLYTTYKNANDQLGSYGLRHGIIPQLSKGSNAFSDLAWADGIKDNLKKLKDKALNSLEPQYDENRVVQRQDGSEVKKVPVYYTRLLNAADLKVDLLEGVLKYSQMSNNYHSMTDIEPNVIVLKTVLNGDFNLGIKGREVAATNSKGNQIFNAITKKVVPKMAREDMLNNRLNEFINDVVYGDSEFEQAINIAGQEVSMNKLSNKAALLTALQNMAANVNGGISNVVVGNFNNSIEAVGRRFYSLKDWAWAQGTYATELPKFVAETVGRGESFINRLADHYDVPQGEFKDHYGQNVSKGTFNKLMKTSTLFFLQKGGEHQIQITGLLAMMRKTKVTDKYTGKEISLYEALKETDNNADQMADRFGWTSDRDKTFRNQVHAVVKNLHGVYNSFDKAMLSRRWYGKLALMFRKYLFKAMTSRWGAKYVDYELGTIDGGYWREFMSKFYSDLKEYKLGAVQRLWSKEGYDDFQKSAINKSLYEFGVILAAFVLAGVIGGSDDDDKSWLESEMALQLTRFSADITQYINPSDFIRVIRNPAASINMIEKYLSWFGQLFHPFEKYERATGFAKKGDSKLYIKTLKLMPVVRQFINLLTPEEQIKFYNLTGR